MDELAVQQLWMAGVVGAMVVFGIAALIGYYRKAQQDTSTEDNEPRI
jgi:hypothetical protein|tara:strand:- start:549 stop:689 length:141 start_codon:yes stop_codon:yes gene_type:complete